MLLKTKLYRECVKLAASFLEPGEAPKDYGENEYVRGQVELIAELNALTQDDFPDIYADIAARVQ